MKPSVAAALKSLATKNRSKKIDMRAAFAKDPRRFAEFSAHLGDMLLDYSKCSITPQSMAALHKIAKLARVEEARDAMMRGDIINTTEHRAVLHTALRRPKSEMVFVDGHNVVHDVHDVLEAMAAFATEVRKSTITDIVNIGIGGSDLGPAMATLALAPYHDGPRAHFVSNVDGADIHDKLKGLNPATTLFIVASKTFTTIETMTNAKTARAWVVAKLGEAAVGDHFCAVSTALDKVKAFGISDKRTFGFWDWVGGRYSVWSSIGLSLMIAIGPRHFMEFLHGAHEMDQHFSTAPAHENLPLLLGLIGIWHRNVLNLGTRAIIPYDQRLSRFPAYLQQLDMESNGKHVTKDGKPAKFHTGPVAWGEPGTNGQHAFFQLLHQGTDIVPVEFLIAAEAHEKDDPIHHTLLVANCLAQSQALMKGRTLKEAEAQLIAAGKTKKEAAALAPHKQFSGNRPSVTIAYRKLDPHTLGRLIALYEHRVFVEGVIWGINSFDQWGVELGKELATGLQPAVEGKKVDGLDGSTLGLLGHLRNK